jgi:hypothetical protein
MSLLSLLLSVTAASAASDYLAEAHKAIDNLEYERAAARLTQARNAPDLDLAARFDLLELTGVVEASLDHPAPATQAFSELLTLQPDFQPRTAWSPKIRAPFHEAVGWIQENGHLELRALTPNATDGAVRVVGLEIFKDPLHLVHAVRLHLLRPHASESTLEAKAPDLVRLDVPPAPEVAWWAEVLDKHLRPLALLGSAQNPVLTRRAAPAEAPAAAVAAGEAAEPSYRPLAYGLGIGGLAAVAGGSVCGLLSNSARNQILNAPRNGRGAVTSLTQRQADAAASQGKTEGLLADGLWVAGGLLLASGVAVYVWGEPVTVAPAPQGVALAGVWP